LASSEGPLGIGLTIIRLSHSRQATLQVLSAGFYPTWYQVSGLRRGRVNACMPLQIAPASLLPEKAPNWASEANTRNFIDVPFDGFLAPPSKAKRLTRILHHQL